MGMLNAANAAAGAVLQDGQQLPFGLASSSAMSVSTRYVGG